MESANGRVRSGPDQDRRVRAGRAARGVRPARGCRPRRLHGRPRPAPRESAGPGTEGSCLRSVGSVGSASGSSTTGSGSGSTSATTGSGSGSTSATTGSGSGSTSATTGSGSGSTSATTGSGSGSTSAHRSRLGLRLDHGGHRLRLGHDRFGLDDLVGAVIVPGGDAQRWTDRAGSTSVATGSGSGSTSATTGSGSTSATIGQGSGSGSTSATTGSGSGSTSATTGSGSGSARPRPPPAPARARRGMPRRPATPRPVAVGCDGFVGRQVRGGPRLEAEPSLQVVLGQLRVRHGRRSDGGCGQAFDQVIGPRNRHAASTPTGGVVPAVDAGVLAAVDAEVE